MRKLHKTFNIFFGGLTTKIFFDTNGEVNYNQIDKNTTVKDLLDAVDEFLSNNSLSCHKCEDSCCKKTWSVEMDNICVNKLCNWDRETALTYVQDNLIKKYNYYRDFFQYVLNKDKNCKYITNSNKCTIYEIRPIICRLYFCFNKTLRYNTLREIVGSTYLKALILEHKININNFTQRTIKKHKRNPAVFTKDYDITLDKIIEYAEEEGWLDPDEKQNLY